MEFYSRLTISPCSLFCFEFLLTLPVPFIVFRLSKDRAHRFSRMPLCKDGTLDADTISELEGRLRTELTFENTTEVVDTVNRNTEQPVKTGSMSKPVIRLRRSAQSFQVHPNAKARRSRNLNKATDAISVFPIKCRTPSRSVIPRCRSVHVVGYEPEKFSPKQGKKKNREMTKSSKPMFLVRQNRTSSFRENLHSKHPTRCRRPRRVPSSGFPALQTSQHNSVPRHTTSSLSSPSASPVIERRFELRDTPPVPAYSLSRSVWRSRLFDGLSVEEVHSSNHLQSNAIHPPLHRGDPQCSSSPVLHHSERTHISEDLSDPITTRIPHAVQRLPEDHVNLGNIPTIQRMHAKLPSKCTQSCETVTGSSNVNSRTNMLYGESNKLYSSTDQNKYSQTMEGFIANSEQLEEVESSVKNKSTGRSSGVDLIVEQEMDKDDCPEREKLPKNDRKIETAPSNNTPKIRVSQQTENTTEVVFGRWFDFNDDYIVEVDPSMFSRVFEGPECAYMLFYRRTNLPSPLVATGR